MNDSLHPAARGEPPRAGAHFHTGVWYTVRRRFGVPSGVSQGWPSRRCRRAHRLQPRAPPLLCSAVTGAGTSCCFCCSMLGISISQPAQVSVQKWRPQLRHCRAQLKHRSSLHFLHRFLWLRSISKPHSLHLYAFACFASFRSCTRCGTGPCRWQETGDPAPACSAPAGGADALVVPFSVAAMPPPPPELGLCRPSSR